MSDFIEEFFDFFDDFAEIIFHREISERKPKRKITLYGAEVFVRPAYIFAERVENFLKTIFGLSIIVSALVSTYWGFTGFSQLMEILIQTCFGRAALFFIGMCYTIIAVWKFAHANKK